MTNQVIAQVATVLIVTLGLRPWVGTGLPALKPVTVRSRQPRG